MSTSENQPDISLDAEMPDAAGFDQKLEQFYYVKVIEDEKEEIFKFPLRFIKKVFMFEDDEFKLFSNEVLKIKEKYVIKLFHEIHEEDPKGCLEPSDAVIIAARWMNSPHLSDVDKEIVPNPNYKPPTTATEETKTSDKKEEKEFMVKLGEAKPTPCKINTIEHFRFICRYANHWGSSDDMINNINYLKTKVMSSSKIEEILKEFDLTLINDFVKTKLENASDLEKKLWEIDTTHKNYFINKSLLDLLYTVEIGPQMFTLCDVIYNYIACLYVGVDNSTVSQVTGDQYFENLTAQVQLEFAEKEVQPNYPEVKKIERLIRKVLFEKNVAPGTVDKRIYMFPYNEEEELAEFRQELEQKQKEEEEKKAIEAAKTNAPQQ